MDTEYTELMGIKIPSLTIPVRPGRNLALIIEIATMNMRQKLMGFNTAEELNEKLMKQLGGE
jgi:HPr kinase/phosphorylase